MTTWQFDLNTIPSNTPVLFFLAKELMGSRIHAGRRVKAINCYITTVGCYFASDAPDILAWRPMVDDPKKENSVWYSRIPNIAYSS